MLKCVVLSVEKISLVTGGCARSVVASSVSVVVVRAITRIRVVEESWWWDHSDCLFELLGFSYLLYVAVHIGGLRLNNTIPLIHIVLSQHHVISWGTLWDSPSFLEILCYRGDACISRSWRSYFTGTDGQGVDLCKSKSEAGDREDLDETSTRPRIRRNGE